MKKDDIWSRQQKFIQRQLTDVRYCRLCGKMVLNCPVDEFNRQNPYYEWEWNNHVHYKCVQQHYTDQVRKQGEDS